MTGCTESICGWLRKARSVDRIIGSPAIGRYCLGTSPGARSPRPAATITAATVSVMKIDAPLVFALSHVRARANGVAGTGLGQACPRVKCLDIALQHLHEG